jgi:hypothetical protein
MQYAADEQAASQIERLFHAPDCMVWELIDAPALPDKEDLPIHRADGVLVGLARPATPPVESALLSRTFFAALGAVETPARVTPTTAIVSYTATFALTLLLTTVLAG